MRSNSFSPLKSQGNLKDRVVTLLTEAVFGGNIRPGERVNESEIARQMGLSRAPIREALQQLQEQGLIENVPRRGMFVIALSDEDIQKINSIRVVLEAEALRLARERYTAHWDEKLVRLIESMERLQGTTLQMTRVDFNFHSTIWSIANNEYLGKVLSSLTAPLFSNAGLTLTRGKKTCLVLDSHRPLLEFLRGLSDESAEEAMVRHLTVRWKDPLKFSSGILKEIKPKKAS